MISKPEIIIEDIDIRVPPTDRSRVPLLFSSCFVVSLGSCRFGVTSFPRSLGLRHLQLASGAEIVEGFLDTFAHHLLTLPHPHPGVEIFLVGFIVAIGIADRRHQIVLLL